MLLEHLISKRPSKVNFDDQVTHNNNKCSCKIMQLNKEKGNSNHVRVVSPRTDDILRCKAESYLLAAKGLLNKVNQMIHFIQLT